MMNQRSKQILIFTVAASFAALGIYLTQRYRFYHMESNWLFLYDWADIINKLQRPGGFALLVSSFLTQFFRLPFVGVAVTSLVYVLSGILIYKILSQKLPGITTAGFSLIPASFLFLCLENDYYGYYGHIALLMVLAVLYFHTLIRSDLSRNVFGLVMIPVIYHLAGSVAVVFVLAALVWELSLKRLKGLYSLAYPIVMALMAWTYVRMGSTGSWETALTPFMYYSSPSTYFFPLYAWVMIPLLLSVVSLLAAFGFKPAEGTIYAVVGGVMAFCIAGNLYGKVHSRSSYRLIQEQYLIESEDWDTLIKTADRRQPTYLISYLNLALANKDILLQNFKYYNPQSTASVMLPVQNLKIGLSLQSNVYMAWDYFAAARQAAFDANVVTPGSCNPRQLQTLIRTNLVLGADPVAEKYITMLEKTLFYRSWAKSMRKELYVNTDKHPSLPEKDEYIRDEGLIGDMRDIRDANPSNKLIAQFCELYEILEKEEAR